jgi:PAS domain S-box-containing protein
MAELPHSSRATDLRSLEQLLDDWPDAVCFYDEDRDRFLFVNQAAERLVGYRRDEIMALQPKDLSHPDDAPDIPAVLAQADRDGWVRRAWRLLRKDGASVQAEMTLSRRVIDGRVISQWMLRVVGDGLLSGAPVDASAAERLKSLDRTRLAVVTLDREGVVTSWNAGATEHFRLAAHETIGRQVLDLTRNEEDRAYVESLMSPHVDRNEWVSRLTIHRPGDEAYEALVTCSAIRSDDGELSGFLMITAPLQASSRASAPRMRRARVQCASCGREVAGTMRRKYCSEKCRQWAYYHRHLDAQRERSRQRHERRRGDPEETESLGEATHEPGGAGGGRA